MRHVKHNYEKTDDKSLGENHVLKKISSVEVACEGEQAYEPIRYLKELDDCILMGRT